MRLPMVPICSLIKNFLYLNSFLFMEKSSDLDTFWREGDLLIWNEFKKDKKPRFVDVFKLNLFVSS